MVLRLADNRDPGSLASRLRAKRLEWFRSLTSGIPRPLRILDVGGSEDEWKTVSFVNQPDIEITIINIRAHETSYKNVTFVVGDARDMRQFADRQFDFVYSNSVIEHVGGPEGSRRMAQEVCRVGKRYFVQTPNRYFPIEPHFVFPFFQFLPRVVQISLVRRLHLGWIGRQPEKQAAEREVDSICLLSWRDMHDLFPDGRIAGERLLGLTKSIIAYRI
jgi:SAM-dependent methyltransferase